MINSTFIKCLLSIACIAFLCHACTVTPFERKKQKEIRKLTGVLRGKWAFYSKTCIVDGDTTIETSTRGRGSKGKRPHTYLKFERDGNVSVHVNRYPHLRIGTLRRYIPPSYSGMWNIEMKLQGDREQPYLNFRHRIGESFGKEPFEFCGFIMYKEDTIALQNLNGCIIELHTSTVKL